MGIVTAGLSISHEAQLPKVNSNSIPLWTTKHNPCLSQCQGTVVQSHHSGWFLKLNNTFRLSGVLMCYNVMCIFTMLSCNYKNNNNTPLNPTTLLGVSVTTGVAALTTELRKHSSNDTKCKELDWVCVPFVVESYGAWEKEALESISQLASRLATCSSKAKSVVLTKLYGRLNLHLVRANAIAILSVASVKVV